MKLNRVKWLGISTALAIALALSGCTFSSSSTLPGKAEDMLALIDTINAHENQVVTGTVSIKAKDKGDTRDYDELATVLSPIYATTKVIAPNISLMDSDLEFEYKLYNGDMSIYAECAGEGFRVITDGTETAFLSTETFISIIKAQMPDSIDKVRKALGDKDWIKAPMTITSEFEFSVPEGNIEDILTKVIVRSEDTSKNGTVKTYEAIVSNEAYENQVNSIPDNLVNTLSITYIEKYDTYEIFNRLEVPGEMALTLRYTYQFTGAKIDKPSEDDVLDTTQKIASESEGTQSGTQKDIDGSREEQVQNNGIVSNTEVLESSSTENSTTYTVDFGSNIRNEFTGSSKMDYDDNKGLNDNFNSLYDEVKKYADKNDYESREPIVDATYASGTFKRYSTDNKVYETIGVYTSTSGYKAMEYEMNLKQSKMDKSIAKAILEIEDVAGITIDAETINNALKDIEVACRNSKEYYMVNISNDNGAEVSIYATNSILTGNSSISIRANRMEAN